MIPPGGRRKAASLLYVYPAEGQVIESSDHVVSSLLFEIAIRLKGLFEQIGDEVGNLKLA